MGREAYLHHRYALIWLSHRVMRTLEPLSAAITCAWLAYGSWEKAVAHTTEAAIMGALLALIFFSSVASLCAGLRFGRAWRELPRGVPWSIYQKLVMVPPLIGAAIVTHYTRLIGRLYSTPAWATIYLLAFFNSLSISVMDPAHLIALRIAIVAHHCAVFAYDAMTTPGWSDPIRGGPYRWAEYAFTAFFGMFFIFVIGYGASARGERQRCHDIQVRPPEAFLLTLTTW